MPPRASATASPPCPDRVVATGVDHEGTTRRPVAAASSAAVAAAARVAGGDGDVAALLGQRPGDGLADAAAPAGHEGPLAGQLQIHPAVVASAAHALRDRLRQHDVVGLDGPGIDRGGPGRGSGRLRVVWTVEHVVYPDDYGSAYPYSAGRKMPAIPSTPIPDPLIWLAYVAAATSAPAWAPAS